MTLPLSRIGRRYGYIPDRPDFRDFGVGHLPLVKATSEKRSNISLMGPVLDQGAQGSCTAHAAAADREFLHWKAIESKNGTVAPGAEGMFSPSFIYYMERLTDGTLNQGDCGSSGRTSCAVLNKYGCCLRADMPYVDSDWTTAPSPLDLTTAAKWPSGGYHRIPTVDDMKSCIASGYNFRVGFAVDEGFEGISNDGMWYKAGSIQGYHETLVIGYDDTINGGCFQVRNSWGRDWGLAGNFYFPYRYAADNSILSDAWVQHLGAPWK